MSEKPAMTKDICEQPAKVKVKASKGNRHDLLQGLAFLSPAVIITGVFIGVSVIFVLGLSFMRVNLITRTYSFMGIQNYVRIVSDPVFHRALWNTVSFSLIVVPIQTFLALVVSYVLNSNLRGKTVFRAIYFLPTLTSSSALTLLFMFIFNINGPVNTFLVDLGMLSQRINFLQDPAYALKVIMVMNVWSTMPFYMTLYLAALQDLPSSMYEAASIDGAGPVKIFFSMTVPYLRPITTYVLLTGIIGTLQMFDQAYIFSNGSGGPQNSTLTMALMVFQNAFGPNNAMGYAAAMAIVLAIIIMVISLIAQRLNKEEKPA